MKNLRARTLWLILLALVLLAVLLLISAIYSTESLNTLLIVLIGIDFVAITFVIQAASFKTFQAKALKNRYTEVIYTTELDLFKLLEDEKFEKRIEKYGESYLKIIDDSAYKVTLVTNPEKYFDFSNEESNKKSNKKLDKCNKFIAFEVFLDSTDEVIKKIPEFTIQGEKVYYTALLKLDENTYKCFNFEDANPNLKDSFDYLNNLLQLKETTK